MVLFSWVIVEVEEYGGRVYQVDLAF